MTSAIYGGRRPESAESRTLGNFAGDKFDYRDQQKNIIQLNNAVGYMSGYMRKMQRGIDDANKNFLQQIQGLISEIFILFAGGGDTGFDFGDLRYIFQAIGALFGFGNGVLPINLFGAAWHFFSTYIIPVGDFSDLMDLIIDGAIASILDVFGEVPVIGQALQQLAVIISTIRDALGPLFDALDRIFGVFSGDWLGGDFGLFDPLWDAVITFFGAIAGPILTALLPILEILASWTIPFIESLAHIVNVAANLIQTLLGGGWGFDDFIGGAFNLLTIIPAMIGNFIQNGLLGLGSPLDVLNLFGQIPQHLFGLIPIGGLVSGEPNLLTAGTFAAATMNSGGGWTLSTAQTHSADSTGSVVATANGIAKALRSNIVPIGEGKTLRLNTWLKWQDLVATGAAIHLDVVKYQNGALPGTYVEVGTQTLFALDPPTLSSPIWVNIAGEFADTPGVDAIAMRLFVDSTATSGTVTFDDAYIGRNGLIERGWVNGLTDFISGFFSIFTGNPFGGITSGLGALEDIWNNFLSMFDITNVLDLASGSFDLFGMISQFAQNVLNPIGFFANLIGGKLPDIQAPNIVGALQSAMNQIGDIFKGNVVTPIFQFVDDVKNWFLGFIGFKQDTIIRQTINQSFTISSTASVATQQLWANTEPIAAMSYPAILNQKWAAYSDSIGPATAGTAHSHELRGGTDNAIAIGPWWQIDSNGTLGAFVSAAQDTVFSKFAFIGFVEGTLPANTDLMFEIFRETPGGRLDLIVNSYVGSHFTNSQKQINLTWTDFRIVARKGEKYLMRIKNLSPTLVVRLKGFQWDTGTPNIQWETDNATDSNKTTYTNAEKNVIINASVITPWFSLGAAQSDILESNTWVDDFGRKELGYFWDQSLVDTGGNLVIVNDRLTYGGTTDGYQQALHIRTLASDEFLCEANLVGVNNSNPISIWCASDRTRQNGLIVEVTGAGARILSLINGTLTQRGTALRISNDGNWSVGYKASTKTYTVLFNGNPVTTGLTWNDSGDLMPKGANNRYFQLQIQRGGGNNAGQVDNWMIQDAR